jgi:tetratricopeptide (TPR) repeat protein
MLAARLLLVPLAAAGLAIAAPNPPPPGPPTLPKVPTTSVAAISDDEARVELARVLSWQKNYDESLAQYRKVLAVRPADAALRAEYGQVLGWAGRREEAVAALSAVPVESLSPAAAVLLADLTLGDNKFAEATKLYRHALVAAPDDLPTRFKLARVLSWQKRYDEALLEFDLLLKTAPADVQVRRHRAQVLGWAGRVEESAAEWRRTLPDAT